MESVPPLFLTIKLHQTIKRLLPVGHHQRLRQYFDIYGCLRCSRNSVVYGANGFCMLCINMIRKRMKKSSRPPLLCTLVNGENVSHEILRYMSQPFYLGLLRLG